MGILDKYQTIEIISEMRNIDKSDVILYNEDKYSLCKLIIREEKAIIIQNWWKNKLDKIYMQGFQESYPIDLTQWFCWGCGENGLNCECFSW